MGYAQEIKKMTITIKWIKIYLYNIFSIQLCWQPNSRSIDIFTERETAITQKDIDKLTRVRQPRSQDERQFQLKLKNK